ncbi:MAG: tetracycline resistance MFS efflux pump [Ardenticatenaceae bacterium]|nr:MAG: tetracycline resistance MFS efflux pump [Ardenticatenaceae bacterium]
MSETPLAAEEKLDFKRILPIFVIVLVDLLGLTIIIPLLPLYATAFGASPFVIGLLAAAYPMMQFLGAPVLGRLSDRYGRKPVLIISQIGTFAGFLLLGFANALWLIFISRLIDGISGANIATAQAAISDSTTEKTRTQGLGLIGAAFGLGFIIGPVIAFVSLALTDNDYRVPAFAAATFSLFSIILTSTWFKETLTAEKRQRDGKKVTLNLSALVTAVKHPAVGLLLVLIFMKQFAFGGFEQMLALFTLNRLGLNASGNAGVFVFVGIIVVTVQAGLIGRWSRKYGDRKLVYAGLGLLAIGLTLMGFTPHQPVPWYSEAELVEELTSTADGSGQSSSSDIPVELPNEADSSYWGLAWLLVMLIPTGIGGGILQPAINSLITKRVAANEVGGMLGISASFFSGANALAPIIGGGLFEALGSTAPFIFWGSIMAILLYVTLRYLKPGREETAVPGLSRGSAH